MRDSAGIRVAENRGDDQLFSATPVLVSDLVPPDSALTAVPWSIAADPLEQRVYVADRYGARVVTFDPTGAYAGSFGRAGEGPGEFRSPSAVTLDSHGAVVVWDTGRRILSRWSSRGDLLNEQQAPLDYWGPGFALGVDGVVAVTSTTTESPMTLEQRLVVRRGQETQTIHAVQLAQAMLELPCVSMPGPKLFAPSVVWANRGDTTYYLNGRSYRIDGYAQGRTVSSIRRPLNEIAVTDEMAIASVRSGPGPYRRFMELCPATAEQIAQAVGHVETVSPVMSLAVDPERRIWVTRTADGMNPDFIDIFSADGKYEGTFDAPGVPVAFLSRTLFVSLRIGESGETIVSLYELSQGSPAGPMSDEQGSLAVGEFQDCTGCPVMVELPRGTFLMGAPDGEAPAALDPNRPVWTELAEKPQVEVVLDYTVAIGKYEVTFAEYDHCVEVGSCMQAPDDEGFGRGDRPVINVTRAEALEYVEWLSRESAQAYRLPSEAEWEYAARGGTTSARYWGDQLGTGMTVCDGCGSEWDKRSTAPVGSFPANPFGLHDMLGNVAEWVADCWHQTLEAYAGDGSARIETSPWWKNGVCERPVRRGGAWRYFPWTVRAAKRTYFLPGPWSQRSTNTGFRVARTLVERE